jgi:hypothetical protein
MITEKEVRLPLSEVKYLVLCSPIPPRVKSYFLAEQKGPVITPLIYFIKSKQMTEERMIRLMKAIMIRFPVEGEG